MAIFDRLKDLLGGGGASPKPDGPAPTSATSGAPSLPAPEPSIDPSLYTSPTGPAVEVNTRAHAAGDLSRLDDLGLPPGRLIFAEEGDQPIAWATTQPGDYTELWRRLAADFPRTGLWPVTSVGLHGDLARPWFDGEFGRAEPVTSDVTELLHSRLENPDEMDEEVAHERWRCDWLGLAPAERPDPTAVIAVRSCPEPMLVLVPVTRPADVPAALGWWGPVNYDLSGADVSAVLRSWEDRFGAVLVSVGFDTLKLSVANPPRTEDSYRQLTQEHYLFCPDGIDQGTEDFDEYVNMLMTDDDWAFWWD